MHRATAAAEAAAASVELALLCSVHNKEVHSCNRARVVCCAAARASSVEASAFFWEPPTGNGANKHKQLCATARNHERALSEYPPCTYVSRCYYGRRAHALCVNLCALRCRKRERERQRGWEGAAEMQAAPASEVIHRHHHRARCTSERRYRGSNNSISPYLHN